MRLRAGHAEPIGLDVGSDAVRLLQLESSGMTLSVVAAAARDMDLSALSAVDRCREGAAAAARLLREGRFRGRRIVAALPAEIVQVKNLRLPQMPAGELDAAVRFEAQSIVAQPENGGEPAMLDYLVAGEVRQNGEIRQEVIVVWAPHAAVSAVTEQFHRAGLTVDALDFGPVALFRTIERFVRRKEDEHEVHVLVDVGEKGSRVVVGRGREINFFKSSDIGGDRFNEAVARRLEITMTEARELRRRQLLSMPAVESQDKVAESPDRVRQAVLDATRGAMEELAQEVGLCLRYCSVTFRGQRPARVRLCGSEAADAGLRAAMQSVLALPAEVARPLYSVHHDAMPQSERGGTMSSWTMAMGLALRRCRGPFAPRDGRSRALATAAEVVDIDDAVKPSLPVAEEVATAGASRQQPEASHA
jgi:type IV pilus assembly protein PilM